MNGRVLIVGDDAGAALPCARSLVGGGYDVRTVADLESTMSVLRSWCPAALVVDLDAPLVDGDELCRRVRRTSLIPLIVLTGSPDGREEVALLDAGADEYLATPVGTEKLLARVRAVLRRSIGAPEAAALGVGEFHIDFHDRRVRLNGQPVRLTPKEFDLFVFLARHPNRVIPHRTLLGAVWGEASADQSEYLRVFMGQLRKKLESDPANPRYFVTEPWVGYRFNPTGSLQ